MKDKKDDIHEGEEKNTMLPFDVEEYSCQIVILFGKGTVSLVFYSNIQGDSVTRSPKLLSIKNYVIELMT